MPTALLDLVRHPSGGVKVARSRWRTPENLAAVNAELDLRGVRHQPYHTGSNWDLAGTGARLRMGLAPGESSRGGSWLRTPDPLAAKSRGNVQALSEMMNTPAGALPDGFIDPGFQARLRQRTRDSVATKRQDLLESGHFRRMRNSPETRILGDVRQDIAAGVPNLQDTHQELLAAARGTPRSTQLGPQPKTASAGTTEGVMTLEEKVIDAFQICDAVINKADQIQREKQAAADAVAEQIPGVVEALIARGLIGPDEKQAAYDALRDPVQTLVLLKRAAAYVTDEQNQQSWGQQVDAHGQAAHGTVKRASHVMGSENSPYVGARTTGPKPSDMALIRGLGLA